MPTDLRDLGASFARYLRAERKSPATLRLYGQSVEFYARWLEDHGKPATADHLSRREIVDWLADLNDTHEATTVRTRYRGLHRFCGWLVAEDEIPTNPMTGVDLPRTKDRPVPVLTDAELAALVKVCAGKDFADRRDMAIIRVLLDCGVRVSELCGLSAMTAKDLDAGMLLVRGKGDKVRPVYFGARTAQALDRYVRVRATSRWSHLDALFLSQRGAMTTDGVRDVIRKRGEAAGITDLHPHRFRHTFAHDFLMAGGQERDLKRLAGWSSDTMLERYGASAADARARAAAERMRRGDRV
ncbi:MAG: tyrosine-type recombinase/integrase [Actinomycetales bacterium]|nr:tyrosine-type recombinase/integrase [Actinomycetales bacterium]